MKTRSTASLTLFAALAFAGPVRANNIEITLRARPTSVQILPGNPTPVWAYEATLVSGPASTVTAIPGSYLGPIIRVRTGDTFTATIINDLPEDTTVHWHGLDVPPAVDGHPDSPIPAGTSRTISFPVINRAGTYWFHPHTMDKTAEQVIKGLAGLFIVSDAEEEALDLPSGAQEIPIVLQDRTFSATNTIPYAGIEQNGMQGYVGNTMLVNGLPNVALPLATRAYRLRFLNGSNARSYKLSWSDGTPITVLGTDGGLLASPVQKSYAMLSPGQRLDVWLDLSARPVGTALTMRSLSFSGFGAGQGGLVTLFTATVTTTEPETRTLPSTLSNMPTLNYADAVNGASPRTFPLTFSMGVMDYTINGRTWMDGVDPANEHLPTRTVEAWRLTNSTGGMNVTHPIHFHGRPFLVYSRSVAAGGATSYATASAGFVDEGWRDTVIVMPGETVTLLTETSHYVGDFVYHCHILEHEDMGMMRELHHEAACLPDVSGDGVIDGSDLSQLLGAWGAGAGTTADINQDGVVSGADLTLLLSAWGGCG